MRLRYLLLLALIFSVYKGYSQQDVDFHLNGTFLAGKNILKVKRDFNDPYLWVLAQNNEVYRINSITKIVDNYTSQFSNYNNLQFIDIAGRSQDTVFIATNSTNVLEYKKGVVKVIGTADGIAGTVNSIGIDATGKNNGFIQKDYIAIIATSNGISRYDYQNEIILPTPKNAASRVFEATYRSEMLGDGEYCRCYPDTVDHFPAFTLTNYTIYGGELWLGGNSFGHNLKTAFYTSGSAYIPYDKYSLYANQFWATENGLFQNYWNYSYTSTSAFPYKHYLKGTNINKITSIFGLLSFGDSYVKENLLVGSSQGLYFTNSRYQHGWSATYTFFHYDELGNKAINDICVNANSYTTTNMANICEDGVWVAANDGLYFIKPDYNPYTDTTKQLQAVQFDGQSSTVSEVQLCANTSVKASVNSAVYVGNAVQWYKDGKELPNESNTTLNITQAGDYNAILYDPCTAIHFETNHLKVIKIAAPVFSFNYADQLSYCDGSTATLKTDNNINYLYRWYKDGALNGNTTASLNTSQSGKYKVEVSACSGNWVASKEVQVDFIKVSQPVIAADKPGYCMGDQASLSINFINDGAYTINWFLDGNLISADQNKTSITTTQAGNYTVSINSNITNCSKVSTSYILNFNNPPNISIQQIINSTLCDGETVALNASYLGGNIKWSTGETTDKIIVKQSGNYSATVTTAAGCTATQNVNIQFSHNPVLALPDATLCQFINQAITLTAPAGFAKYEWNGQQGDSSFSTGKLGSVVLKVTDYNGCVALQTINISSHCDDIHLPNTFTPNSDGINDTWVIAGLEGDASSMVRVYNRYGKLVFQSSGYTTPWDGTFEGKKLSPGVYYYVISARAAKQVLSGSLTVIY